MITIIIIIIISDYKVGCKIKGSLSSTRTTPETFAQIMVIIAS